MKLSGDWEKLAKKLEKLATDTPQKVGMTLKQVAEQTIKEVKEETPADTGQLRMGWHRENGGSFSTELHTVSAGNGLFLIVQNQHNHG